MEGRKGVGKEKGKGRKGAARKVKKKSRERRGNGNITKVERVRRR